MQVEKTESGTPVETWVHERKRGLRVRKFFLCQRTKKEKIR